MFLTNSYLPMWSTFYSEYVSGKKEEKLTAMNHKCQISKTVFQLLKPCTNMHSGLAQGWQPVQYELIMLNYAE